MRPSPEPVLLLHGQPGSAYDWAPVQAAVGDRVRTFAFDRPGWDGRSRAVGLAGNVEAAVRVLDAEGIERATVAGHSLGGAIAAWLAAEHPERVSALVLAAPSASCASLNRLDELLAAPVLGPLLTVTAFTGLGLSLRAAPVRRRVSSQFSLTDPYLRRYARDLLSPSAWSAFAFEQRRLIRDLPALDGRLAEISVPTTIAIGTGDWVVTPDSARDLAARIPAARVVELPHASHLLLQQRPAEVADLIVEAALLGAGPRAQDSPG